MIAPTDPDRTGVVARLDALEAAHKAATPGKWEEEGYEILAQRHRLVAETGWRPDAAAIVAEHNAFPELLAAVRGVLALAETWTRYPQSPEDRERNRYGAAMEDCGNNLRATVAAALGEA